MSNKANKLEKYLPVSENFEIDEFKNSMSSIDSVVSAKLEMLNAQKLN